MPVYTDLNRKLIAHKGHLTRAIKMFQDIMHSNPLRDTVEKLYLKTEEKFDNVSQIVDELFLLLDTSEKSEIESIQQDKETLQKRIKNLQDELYLTNSRVFASQK